jgi:galactitol-specific phosphotransferase system IIC component
MTSHLGLLVLFALFVSVIFAVLMRDKPAEQLRFGLRLLAGFIGAALVLSWLMYPLPL